MLQATLLDPLRKFHFISSTISPVTVRSAKPVKLVANSVLC